MGYSLNKLGVIAILSVSTALVYANSLQNPFVIDDQHIIVRNFLLRQWTLWDILKSHLFAPLGIETQYFRPLTLLSFAINYSFSGLDPQGYHILNLALHLAVVALAYYLLMQLVSPWIAGFSAALFAVHPANVQAVGYISSRSDPLYTALTLLSLLSWVKGNGEEGVKKIFFRGFSLASFFLGLCAKETAIVTPALVVLIDLVWDKERGWREKLIRNRGWYMAFGLVVGIYILIRTGAGYGLTLDYALNRVSRELTAWPRILLALELLGLYLGLALYPLNLSFFRSVPIPEGPFELPVLLGVALLVLLISSAWFLWSRLKAASYGILWFLISIMPVLNLSSLNAPMMEHWLYFPLIGFALAFVSCLRTLAEKIGEVRGVAIGLALLAILLSLRTVSRNAEWTNPILLFQNDARRHPNEEKNWFLLGYAYFERGIPNQAIQAYKAGLAINPNHAYGWSGLAEALSMAGKDDEAEKSFLRAIAIMPENPWFHYALGIERLKTGKVNGAIEALKRATSSNPPLPFAYHVLGSAYLRQGKADEAQRAFSRALAMLPQAREPHAAVHIELGKLYMEVGDQKAAREEWQLALRFDPNSKEASSLLRKVPGESESRKIPKKTSGLAGD